MNRSRYINPKARLHPWVHRATWISAVVALLALVLEYGFYERPITIFWLETAQAAAVLLYIISRVASVVTATRRWETLKSLRVDGVILLAGLVYLLFRVGWAATPALSLTTICVATLQGLVIVRLAVAAARLNLYISQATLHPARMVAITFLVLIVGGSLGLMLPRATRQSMTQAEDYSLGQHALNCAFTATSATCVTGLIVYDTGTDFTRFGQVIILLLIQLGGLGIMIFGSAFGLLLQRQLSLRQSLVLQDAISHRTLGDMRALVWFIITFTLIAEAIGAAMLYPMWDDLHSRGDRLFHSVFHAVSAFCNAGFALRADSMTPFNRSWQVYGAIMPLIVLGGLGFPVLHDLWRRAGERFRELLRRRPGVSLVEPKRVPIPLRLHTRLVLISSLMLIMVPACLYYLFESAGPALHANPSSTMTPHAMASADWPGRMLDALFLSVTSRTAGFNSVPMDVNALTPATHFLTCVLMFIGGSPASAAGGVKTTAITVLALAVWTLFKGRDNVEVMHRTIPNTIVRRTGVVVLTMFGVVSAVTLTLCFTEGLSLRESLFESVSACGTVGLSTGLTPDLSIAGRMVVMFGMFMGRLGPLSILIALAGRQRAVSFDYPKEHVVIG